MSRVTPLENPITIELDGRPLPARAGEPVAASVIAHGELLFARSPKYHRPRGPFCMSGSCSQCLMRVDGVPNVPTCRVPAREGLRLERQNAVPDARVDLLRATDFVFQQWFNHHEFLTGLPLAEAVLVKVARQLSGLGILPKHPSPPRPAARFERLGTVIVGGGPAGLAVARRLEEAGHDYRVFDREHELGGRLLWGAEDTQETQDTQDTQDPHGPNWTPPADRSRLGSLVVGLFADDGFPFLAVLGGGHLTLVQYERIVLALGGHPVLPTFPNNDLPGVMAGRAVSALVRRHRVLPGKVIACLGEPTEAAALGRLVTAAGGTAIAVGAEIVRAHGLRRVEGVTVVDGGAPVKHSCEVIALCGPVGASFELARAAGATIRWDERSHLFVVEADELGRTCAPGVWVAGEQCGPMSPKAAAEHGARVGGSVLTGASCRSVGGWE